MDLPNRRPPDSALWLGGFSMALPFSIAVMVSRLCGSVEACIASAVMTAVVGCSLFELAAGGRGAREFDRLQLTAATGFLWGAVFSAVVVQWGTHLDLTRLVAVSSILTILGFRLILGLPPGDEGSGRGPAVARAEERGDRAA